MHLNEKIERMRRQFFIPSVMGWIGKLIILGLSAFLELSVLQKGSDDISIK